MQATLAYNRTSAYNTSRVPGTAQTAVANVNIAARHHTAAYLLLLCILLDGGDGICVL